MVFRVFLELVASPFEGLKMQKKTVLLWLPSYIKNKRWVLSYAILKMMGFRSFGMIGNFILMITGNFLKTKQNFAPHFRGYTQYSNYLVFKFFS
jgi:hypothetical protein